jgi:hypothetical protein
MPRVGRLGYGCYRVWYTEAMARHSQGVELQDVMRYRSYGVAGETADEPGDLDP